MSRGEREMLNIRRATISDSEAIAGVHVTAWRETYRDLLPEIAFAAMTVPIRVKKWRDILDQDPSLPVYLAEQKGVAVGFANGGPARQDEALGMEMQIYSLYVLASAQRQGIGTKLIQTVVKDFLAQRATSASVWTLREATIARRFYESMGAQSADEKVEHRPGYDRMMVGYVWDNLKQAFSVLTV